MRRARLRAEIAYRDGERTPHAMEREDGAEAYLFYDQVGSLRVVADAGDNVIKEVLYDPFGGIIEDSNPGLRIPIGFAGGLHDRNLGFVRFGWRDYDAFTGRWTAPDPIGDAGGDPDWYGYCLDDPVNSVDPMGLFTEVRYYDSGLFGHIAVAPGGGEAWGKYPKDGVKDIKSGQGEYRKENGLPAKTIELETTPEQESFMKEYQQRARKSTSVRYDLGKTDCVDAACNILKSGGLNVPSKEDHMLPSSYFNLLKKKK